MVTPLGIRRFGTTLHVHKILHLVLGVTSVGAATHCSNEYPIAPTFCDEFCHATLRSGCDTEPDNCVRECELQAVGPACEPKQQALLRCYQRADEQAFECSRFSSPRVKGGVCQTERDAMLTCELPPMQQCLAVCRPYQALLDERVQSPVDAGVTQSCALLRQSCEGICWNLLSIGSLNARDLDGAAPAPLMIPEDVTPTELLAEVAPLLRGCGLDESNAAD